MLSSNVVEHKKYLRSLHLDSRKLLSETVIKRHSISFLQKAQSLIVPNQTVAFFYPINHEPDVSKLWEFAWEQGCKVLLPNVISPSEIVFSPYLADMSLTEGPFHTREPILNPYLGEIDTMFVPGLAFGQDGSRLGYGAGYYDRFLDNKKTQTIGVCYQQELYQKLPSESHDQFMNYVLTEEYLYQIASVNIGASLNEID